jgi:prefoldin subunit 5
MVECGAGYYMEKNFKDASEYCERKVKAMNDNVTKVGEYMQIKKEHMTRVQQEYNKRM